MTDLYPDLDTPALLIDLDILESNVTEMAKVASDAGVRLRPHTKTHKCPDIARMQVDAGASGITVAKLGEAEVMVDAGRTDVLIAYPVWGEMKLRRFRALAERASVRVSLDSVEVAEGIGPVGAELHRDMPVLVEVDTGLHRLGRPPGQPTAELAAAIARVPGVEVIGLLTHAGHAYRSTSPEELRAAAEREALDLLETAELCAKQGLELSEISVGSTPTARVAAKVPGVTEIRPGTYVFNDVQQMRLGVATEATCAARVLVTVVARPSAARFVVDAGTKAFTSDGGDGPPFPGRGIIARRSDLVLDFMNEEHGVGHVERDGELAIGERLEVVPLHVCSTVNMFDRAAGVRGGSVERELEIAGRGRMR
ncbi:MAG: alanine racemase [Actinomycetota bacterium]|nr:alanine racemase [Actinomycetota bacterium]